MPQLLAQILPGEYATKGPQSSAQHFFHKYATMVDAAQFHGGDGQAWYKPECIFHNQNNVDYTGTQMFPWMASMFGQFEDLKHDILSSTDVGQDDGSSMLYVQFVRKVWKKGGGVTSATGNPDIKAPVYWMCRVERVKEGVEGGTDGWWFGECWIYWDTMLLAPIMPAGSVVFRTKNPNE